MTSADQTATPAPAAASAAAAPVAAAAATPARTVLTCTASASCRRCGAVVSIAGEEPATVLRTLQQALDTADWRRATSGHRLCLTCATLEGMP
jgi:hypothetical protein